MSDAQPRQRASQNVSFVPGVHLLETSTDFPVSGTGLCYISRFLDFLTLAQAGFYCLITWQGVLEVNMGWAKRTEALGLKEGEVQGERKKRLLGISKNRLRTLQSLHGNGEQVCESTLRGRDRTEH